MATQTRCSASASRRRPSTSGSSQGRRRGTIRPQHLDHDEAGERQRGRGEGHRPCRRDRPEPLGARRAGARWRRS
jgi:hypothetical protein